MEIPNSVRYFQRLNEMVKELAKEFESEKKGEKMPRLIDANKLKPIQVYRGDVYCKMVFMADIENAPTVDAVEVVRCKDCRFHNTHRCYMAFDLVATDDMDYCSKGERKEDAKTN